MLAAMASGGRVGFDAPYMSRRCDFRWFTSEEICEIFGRFEKVILVGDSMLRHVTGCFNIFLRRDLGYGAVTDWNFNVQERYVLAMLRIILKVLGAHGVSSTERRSGDRC